MRIEFDDGTLLLADVPKTVPYAEWDDRVDKYRAQAYRYRALLYGTRPKTTLVLSTVMVPVTNSSNDRCQR